jgi:Ca2+-binding RTX toxin-like protein
VAVAAAEDPVGIAIYTDADLATVLSYRAASAQRNDVDAQLTGGNLVVTDAGVTSIADADGAGGCTATGNRATCPTAGITRIRIRLGDLNDVLSVSAALPTTASLLGEGGDDYLAGGIQGEFMDGGDGNDTIRPGSGGDHVDGGPGSDTVTYSERVNRLSVNWRNAAVGFVTETEPLFGLVVDSDTINTATVENITTGAGNDTILGSPKANVLNGGLGADILSGGPGTDTADYSDRTHAVVVRIGDGPNDGDSEGDDVQVDVENVIGGTGNDDLHGQDRVAPTTDPVNPLSGREGMNLLSGGPGDDALDGQFDADVLNGGGGVDTVYYGTRDEAITGTIGTASDDGGSNDINAFLGRGDSIGDDVENVIGGSGDDILGGDADDNSLYGGGGADLIDGGLGDDWIQGGPGYDAADYSSAPSGVDLDLLIVGPQETFGAGVDHLTFIEDLIGSPDSDYLYGNDEINYLNGGAGDDYIDVSDNGSDDADCAEGDLDLATVAIDDHATNCEFLNNPAPPETTIESGPAGVTPDRISVFTFSSNEPGSDFECRVDSGGFAFCTSPHPTPLLGDGQHMFEVRAIDLVGDVDPTPAARSFSVGARIAATPAPVSAADTTGPVVRLRSKRLQRAVRRGAVLIEVRCPTEACTARAQGVLLLGAGKRLKLKPAEAQIAQGGKARLKLRMAKKTLAAVRHALKKRKRVRAKVTVSAKDRTGNLTLASSSIRIK